MKTANAVTDDTKMDNEKLGAFTRRTDELKKRINQGSVGYDWVMDQLQRTIEGLGVMKSPSNLFYPHIYFKTRAGLYLCDGFGERVLSKQKASMSYRGCEGLTSFDFLRRMTDMEIIDGLLGGMDEVHAHAVTLDQVAEKIDLQPNGEAGELLNNGNANIFYVLVAEMLFAVRVGWHSGDREWHVSAWHLGEDGFWCAGGRVFRNMTLTV